MPTVHQNLNELTQAGLVRIDGVGESTGGRRPLQLTINENAHFSVGISVTDDHFRIIAANLRLDEIAHQKYPHPHCNNMKEMGNFLAADLENFLNRFGLNREKLLGVGIALPAIFNTDRTCVVTAPTLNLRDQSIRPLICSIPYPVSVCNDATSGGYAEWYVQQDSDCMAYISLEGGVGGAIFMNGVPYTGLNGRSGKISLRTNGVETILEMACVEEQDTDAVPGKFLIELPCEEDTALVTVKFYLHDGYHAPRFDPDPPVEFDTPQYNAMIARSCLSKKPCEVVLTESCFIGQFVQRQIFCAVSINVIA